MAKLKKTLAVGAAALMGLSGCANTGSGELFETAQAPAAQGTFPRTATDEAQSLPSFEDAANYQLVEGEAAQQVIDQILQRTKADAAQWPTTTDIFARSMATSTVTTFEYTDPTVGFVSVSIPVEYEVDAQAKIMRTTIDMNSLADIPVDSLGEASGQDLYIEGYLAATPDGQVKLYAKALGMWMKGTLSGTDFDRLLSESGSLAVPSSGELDLFADPALYQVKENAEEYLISGPVSPFVLESMKDAEAQGMKISGADSSMQILVNKETFESVGVSYTFRGTEVDGNAFSLTTTSVYDQTATPQIVLPAEAENGTEFPGEEIFNSIMGATAL